MSIWYFSLHVNIALITVAAAAAKLLQSCLTLYDPTDGSPPGSPIPGILQTRTLEWVAISFSNAWKRKVKVKLLSRVRLPATPWTAAYQAPPSMGFSRQEYWSWLPFPSPCWTLGGYLKYPYVPLHVSTYIWGRGILPSEPGLKGWTFKGQWWR